MAAQCYLKSYKAEDPVKPIKPPTSHVRKLERPAGEAPGHNALGILDRYSHMQASRLADKLASASA